MNHSPEAKSHAVGGRIWFSAIFFGLVGQIAWVVENMYFAAYAQDVFAASGRADLSYLVTTLMVIFSALTATATTVIAGGLSDRAGKRKPFIAVGYILWGFTIMLFSLIPMKVAGGQILLVAAALVLFDCLMTVAGSTSNDAAFNAWVADNTKPENRGRVNAVLSILPIAAVVIVFIGLGSLYDSSAESNSLFFLVLGAIPIFAGILALFVLKDKAGLAPAPRRGLLADFFAGFAPSAIRGNAVLYLCLGAACLVGIAQQTFFSYLINFLQITLGFGEGFVIPMAVIILLSALFTAGMGMLFDRFGRDRFSIPLLCLTVLGILFFWLLQFTDGGLRSFLVYFAGTLMMGGILSLTGSLTATFQDHIPAGAEGRYQGVRMCFVVLIPMIVGPIVSLILGMNAMGMNGEGFVPPYSMFLAAAIIASLALIPILLIRRITKTR